jgi:hypothetical protein
VAADRETGPSAFLKMAILQQIQKQNPATLGGLPLKDAQWLSGTFNAVASGDTDLITAPSGKRVAILAWHGHNTTAGSIGLLFNVKVSGTYYRISTLTTAISGAQPDATPANVPAIILEPGESFAVNATAAGVHLFVIALQYDNTCPIRTYKITDASMSAGADATVFTASGNGAVLLDSMYSPFCSLQSGATVAPRMWFGNTSGGTRTYNFSITPSGGSNTIPVASATLINNNRASVICSASLAAGDAVKFKTDSVAANQLAWVNVAEY